MCVCVCARLCSQILMAIQEKYIETTSFGSFSGVSFIQILQNHTEVPVHFVLSRFQAPPPGWVIQYGFSTSCYNRASFLRKAFADRLCVLGYQSEVSYSMHCTGRPNR